MAMIDARPSRWAMGFERFAPRRAAPRAPRHRPLLASASAVPASVRAAWRSHSAGGLDRPRLALLLSHGAAAEGRGDQVPRLRARGSGVGVIKRVKPRLVGPLDVVGVRTAPRARLEAGARLARAHLQPVAPSAAAAAWALGRARCRRRRAPWRSPSSGAALASRPTGGARRAVARARAPLPGRRATRWRQRWDRGRRRPRLRASGSAAGASAAPDAASASVASIICAVAAAPLGRRFCRPSRLTPSCKRGDESAVSSCSSWACRARGPRRRRRARANLLTLTSSQQPALRRRPAGGRCSRPAARAGEAPGRRRPSITV